MKNILIILVLPLLMMGCAQKNAFSLFELSKKQERSENSIQSSKIKNAQEANGVVSVVYLNAIEPKLYRDAEYFYIYYYVKSGAEELSFTLNNRAPLEIEKLKSINRFTELTNSNSEWQEYYLVKFEEQGDILNIRVLNAEFSSESLKFEKDE